MKRAKITGLWSLWSGNERSHPIQPRLLSIDQVSQYLDLSIHTVYRMVSQRRIPFVKIGRLTKFDLRALDLWIEKRSVRPIAPPKEIQAVIESP